MKSLPWILLVAVFAAAPVAAARQPQQPNPLYSIDVRFLAQFKAGNLKFGALVFLTDHTVAVSLCPYPAPCGMAIFDLSGGLPTLAGQSEGPAGATDLYRAADGGLILARIQGFRWWEGMIYSPKLQYAGTVDGVDSVSGTGRLFENSLRKDGWLISSFADPSQPLAHGGGLLLGYSDSVVVAQDHDTAILENMDGELLATLPMADGPRVSMNAYVVGNDKVLLEQSHLTMVNFKGEILYKMRRLDGWGVRIGQSADGSRLLFDQFTRHVGFWRSFDEDAIAIATLGVGVDDEVSNGEAVTVIDSSTGRTCFHWQSKNDLLSEGQNHADIDPSGKLAAILTVSNIYVYRLPETCPAH